MPDRNIKVVPFPDGQPRRVEIIDFEIVKENWNEYTTSVGLKIRVKQTAQKIYWLVDEKDNRIYQPSGDPVLVVLSANQVVTIEE